MVVEIRDTQVLMVINSIDELEELDEDSKEDLEKDLQTAEPEAKHSIKDAESAVSRDDTDRCFESSKELGDRFDSDYDSSRYHQDDSTFNFLVNSLFGALQLVCIVTFCVSYGCIYTQTTPPICVNQFYLLFGYVAILAYYGYLVFQLGFCCSS